MPDLAACASSPRYFFIANDATGITNQLPTMVQLMVRMTSHLTQ